MSDMIAVDSTALPSVFQAADDANDELTAGISSGFGVISYRGRVWRVKYKGEEAIITNDDGDPKASLECVMLRSASILTKQYYAKQYVEGDDSEPDCFSSDGVKPDAGAPQKQADLCATCPKNAFGSKITDSGKKAKACSDTKRVAIVPYPDLDNEAYGGPLLLRIPPSALSDLAHYAQKLKAAGLPYYAVVTKLSFDLEASYPKLKFDFVKVIDTQEEAAKILELRDSPVTDAIVNSAPVQAAPALSTVSAEPVPEEPAIKPTDSTPEEGAATPSASDGTPDVEQAPEDVDALVASLLAED